jgi:hypothetical protein
MGFFSLKEIVCVAVWMLVTKARFAFSDECSHPRPTTTFTTTSTVDWVMDVDVGDNRILVVHPSEGKNKSNNTPSEQGHILCQLVLALSYRNNRRRSRGSNISTTSSTMKSTIAASTILAQTLPTRILSDEIVPFNRWTQHQEEDTTTATSTGVDFSQFLAMLQKEQKQVTTKSSSRATNVRKRLSRLLQDRRQSRRPLTNKATTAPGPSVKACDPSSADADIGLFHVVTSWSASSMKPLASDDIVSH